MTGCSSTAFSSQIVFDAPGDVLLNKADRPAALGRQLVIDLYRCATAHLDDLEWVQATMMEAARRAEATIVESVFHKFSPWGISGVVVIAESHLAVHIWPERRYAAVDVFTCGASLGLHTAMNYLVEAFQSDDARVVEVSRGRQDHMIGLAVNEPESPTGAPTPLRVIEHAAE